MKILCLTGMPQTGKTTLINELTKIEGVEAIKIGEEYRKRFTPEERYWEATGAVSQAAVEVTPVDGATPFAQSIAAYTSGASAIVAPTDSRIGDAYKTLVSDIVKVSTGAMSAEDAINESLALVQQ